MALKRVSRPSGWYPKRGEVCLIGLDKERPALVISSDTLNPYSLDVCVVPISTVELKAFSIRPKVKAGEGGLDRDSWVKCDQVTTVEKARVLFPALGSLSKASLARVEAAIKQSLDLP
jgi:mRNA interferase MazF